MCVCACVCVLQVAAFKQWGKPTEATFRFLETRLRELSPMPVRAIHTHARNGGKQMARRDVVLWVG